MKRAIVLTIIFSALLLCSCRGRGNTSVVITDSSVNSTTGDILTTTGGSLVTTGSGATSNTGASVTTQGGTAQSGTAQSGSTQSGTTSSTTSSSIPEEDEGGAIITISQTRMDLVVGSTKTIYLTINVPVGYEYDPEGGQWISSNADIVTVSQYGKISPVATGQAYVIYKDSNNVESNKCSITVYASEPTKAWVKVTDFDSISNGDVIVFGCPEFGVTATNNRKDGYVIPTQSTFSGDTITELGEGTAEYFVGDSGDGASLTLENQEGYYLAGKKTELKNGLLFVKSKGQIHWIFERSGDYDYCVNYDIETDLWLMFNKISNTDIRFNLYDSNETALMKLPKVYRWQVVS